MRHTGFFWLALALVVCSAQAPADLAAQDATVVPRTEWGLDASHWGLDGGTASAQPTALWGATVRFGIRPSTRHPRTLLEAGAFYAPADRGDLDPRIGGFQLGIRLFVTHPARRRRVNLSFSLGWAVLHFDARRLEDALAECAQDDMCLFEGILYSTGWRSAVLGGAAVEFSVAPTFSVRFAADLLAPVGNGGGSTYSNHLRSGLGVSWRP